MILSHFEWPCVESDEVIDIICNYLNIKRTYGLLDDCKSNQSTNDRNESRQLFEIHCRTKLNHSRRAHGIKQKAMKKSGKIKWTDIARSVKSTNLSRRMRIPCTTFLEKGICMNGDTCKFTHGKAALVKPRLVTMNSKYEETLTEGEGFQRSNLSTFILPEQGEDEPHCCKGGHSRTKDNAITLSSDDSDIPFMQYSPPKIYTPPSMLDSPLWYKELGLVVEETDTDSSSAHEKRKLKNCLLVSNIPPSMNRIGIVNKHFRKYGILRNIEVRYRGDPKRALVEFRLSRDMLAANKSVEAVMGNRFIKTRAFRKKRLKNEFNRRHMTKSRSRSKERSVSYNRDNRSRNRKNKSKSRSNESRTRDRSRNRNRDSRSRTRDSRSRTRDSRSRTKDSRSRNRDSRSRTRGSRSAFGCSRNRVTTTRTYKDRRSKEKRFKKRRKNRDISRESDEIVSYYSKESSSSPIVTKEMSNETSQNRRVVIKQECSIEPVAQTPLDLVVSIREEMETDNGAPVIAGGTVTGVPISASLDDISDVKLERALNDSDVDSLDSDDSLGRRKRGLQIEKRRLQLRRENEKNSAVAKLKRVSDSLAHYKTTLEALIIEFKTSDKMKKAILIPKIKENHARFMQLKELHARMNAKKRSLDPVEGQINELQTNIVDQLNVTPAETDLSSSKSVYIHVPTDVVLYQEQLQTIVGRELEIISFEMAGYSNSSILYIITLESHLSTCQALKMLMLSQESTNWKVSMSFSEPC